MRTETLSSCTVSLNLCYILSTLKQGNNKQKQSISQKDNHNGKRKRTETIYKWSSFMNACAFVRDLLYMTEPLSLANCSAIE